MNRPIGVIDSGVGGLTVAYELMRQLPKESLIYVGDTKRCPYGPRPKEEVRKFVLEIVEFLLDKDIKMLIIACNTATAYVLEELEETLTIPVMGVIQPGARSALKVTNHHYIGVIGTEGTVQSSAYSKELICLNPNITVQELACPTFVPLVESGVLQGNQAEDVVRRALEPIEPNVDTLILGCTHYPLLKDTIRKVIGPSIQLVSSSEETAREASTILKYNHALSDLLTEPNHYFYTTGDVEVFSTMTKRIFNKKVDNLKSVTFNQAFV